MTLHTLQIGMEWFSELPGGLNRVYAQLLSQLDAQGVESYGLVVGSPDVERVSGGLARAFAPINAPLLSRLRALRTAARPWLRAHGGDSPVVSHFALHGFPLLGLLGARPFLVHFQGPWGEESRMEGASRIAAFAKEQVERRVYDRADAAIVLSTAFRDLLASRFHMPRERIHVIPGGVDAARFASTRSRADCRDELGWPVDRPIVLCVRRLVHRVGLDVLIDAAVDLRRRVPDALVLIVGTGPLRADLVARIAWRDLGDHVKLIGFLPDPSLPTAYRAADLSVVPSIALEGFGLITVESLASGTPCIVTPVGGLTDIMQPFAPELVTASLSPIDLADAIATALRGERSLPSPEQCAAYAREHFDWPVIASRVRTVYAQAVS